MLILRKAPGTELVDLLDRMLDKGIMIDGAMGFSIDASDFSSRAGDVLVATIETYIDSPGPTAIVHRIFNESPSVKTFQ